MGTAFEATKGCAQTLNEWRESEKKSPSVVPFVNYSMLAKPIHSIRLEKS